MVNKIAVNPAMPSACFPRQLVPFSRVKNTIKIKDYTFNYSSSLKVRYVKLIAKKLGELPTWHLGYPYDGRSWLFIDEIQIK